MSLPPRVHLDFFSEDPAFGYAFIEAVQEGELDQYTPDKVAELWSLHETTVKQLFMDIVQNRDFEDWVKNKRVKPQLAQACKIKYPDVLLFQVNLYQPPNGRLGAKFQTAEELVRPEEVGKKAGKILDDDEKLVRSSSAGKTELVRLESTGKILDDERVRHEEVGKIDNPMRNIVKKYQKCGKKNCCCQNGNPHGPYYHYVIQVKGKKTWKYIGKDLAGYVDGSMIHSTSSVPIVKPVAAKDVN